MKLLVEQINSESVEKVITECMSKQMSDWYSPEVGNEYLTLYDPAYIRLRFNEMKSFELTSNDLVIVTSKVCVLLGKDHRNMVITVF